MGGSTAPPTIDIIRRLDPGFVSAPISCIPNAKIVGNIIDIKNAMPIMAYTVIIPVPKMAIRVKRILINAYRASNFGGCM